MKETMFGKPRYSSEKLCREMKQEGRFVPLQEFQENVIKKNFSDGPYKESFGDGYGEPYNPYRQAYGTLKDGTVIFAELNKRAEKEAFESLGK